MSEIIQCYFTYNCVYEQFFVKMLISKNCCTRMNLLCALSVTECTSYAIIEMVVHVCNLMLMTY